MAFSLTRKKIKFCILVSKSVLKMTHKILNTNLPSLLHVSLFACHHRYVGLHTSLSIPSTLFPLEASSLFIAFPKHNIVYTCPDHHIYILTYCFTWFLDKAYHEPLLDMAVSSFCLSLCLCVSVSAPLCFSFSLSLFLPFSV